MANDNGKDNQSHVNCKKMLDIENVMRYFSVNQVEKERYYKGAYKRREKI